MKKKMNKSERWRTYWAIFIESSVLASIYSFRVGLLPQWWRVLILYVAYPSLPLSLYVSLSLSLVSGCSSVRKNRNELLAPIISRPPFAFPGNCSRSLSLQSRYIFIEKLKRERERERGRKSHQYFTIGARCRLLLLFSFSFCCINNSLRHDRWTINSLSMRKSDFSLSISLVLSLSLSPSLSFPSACLSILWLAYNSIIILWRNSRSSWQYHLSSKWMGIRDAETEIERGRARAGEREEKK